MFTVVVLTADEEFICFLDPELVDIVEENEQGAIGRIAVEYTMNDVTEAESLFKLGNKILILNDNNLKDCLYVINTSVKRDFFKENKVSFTAEDKLVELNNVIFSQTELTSDNGFTIRRINNEDNVLINYNALSYWFGSYFNIGVVQDCLSENLQRVVLTGTMTMMELLRYLEEETGNVFRTRYEKDVQTNTIHPYLDFLNPINSSKNWELNIDYSFYDTTPEDPSIPLEDPDGEVIDEGTITPEEADIFDEDDIVDFPAYVPDVNIDPTNLQFELWNDNILVGSWNASDVGLDEEYLDVTIQFKYENNALTIIINGKIFTAASEDIGGASKGFVLEEVMENNFEDIFLGNDTLFRIVNINNNNSVVYEQNIMPCCGNVHGEILDVAYNVENIEYEVDEEDTFTAIAPILSKDSDLTRTQINTVLNRWINLEVEKGDIIPMIVQRITYEGTMTGYNVHSKYYNRPLKPNDQSPNKEYWVGTAYWTAPFTKHAGDIFIEDEEGSSDVQYSHITTRQDDYDPRGFGYSPKIGTVETSDEDPYAIYNDVAMKLREKKYPKISLEVDVANLKNGKYNDYNLHDKVYIKVPGFTQVIQSTVVKTSKNAHDIGENTVELNNDCVFSKTAPVQCDILVNNVSWKYPAKKNIICTLVDFDGNPIPNKLISVNVNKIENETTMPTTTVYNRKTNKDGQVILTLNYDPGDYDLDYSFGGDVEYEAVSTTARINISGKKNETTKGSDKKTTTKKAKTKTAKTKTKDKKQYYNKYGVTPNGKYIIAIGKPSVKGELTKYKSSNYYRTLFYRKCPNCGSTHLYWSIFWAGNETRTSGKFPVNKKWMDGSNKGLIVCTKCGSKYSVLGNSQGLDSKKLRVYNGPYKTKKTEAYTLKKGQKEFKRVEKIVRSKKIIGNNKQPKYDVDSKVEKKARKIVGNSTGIAAAKKIAKWCGKHIHYKGYANFHRSPRKVLTSRKGNCCDQTRLMLMMMDAVGVTQTHKLIYMHVVRGARGHVFAKVNGKYVDPCKTRTPWGHYVHGYGSPGSAPSSVYPNRPF